MRKSDEGTTNAGKTRPHTPPHLSLRPTSRHTHRRHSWPSGTRGLVRRRRRLPRRRTRPSRAETDIAKGYQLIQVLKVVAVPSPTPRTCRRRSRRARGATGGRGAAYSKAALAKEGRHAFAHLISAAGSISVFSICVRASADRSSRGGARRGVKKQ